MKKIYTLTIALIFSVLSVFAQDPYFVNSSGSLNLRKGAGSQYETITSIPAGAKVIVLEQSDSEWWKVSYKGEEGYVSSRYLSSEKPSDSNNNSTKGSTTSGSQNRRSTAAASNNYNFGIGVHLGDPSGVSFIKYLPSNKAFEVNLGRTVFYGHDFTSRFDRIDDYDNYTFESARHLSSVGLQAHYLIFNDIRIDGMPGSFKWYYGFGGQVKMLSIEYRYRDENYIRRTETFREIDFGADATIGAHYLFENVPVSLFTELTLFGEIYNNPFLFRAQGGLGARYNF